MKHRILSATSLVCLLSLAVHFALPAAVDGAVPLGKVTISPDGQTFQTEGGAPFQPFGMTYYRPGTGWAPQIWKQFDPEATRNDFARMKELGVNCVRVFLTFGSFLMDAGGVSEEGIAKFDQFVEMAERAGIYVHPTGPDHWEGTPDWARGDRIADEGVLSALETFWTQFATRYRGRNVIFAYDLRNEPEVAWDTPAMRQKWNHWLETKYGTAANTIRAWGVPDRTIVLGKATPPEAKDSQGNAELLDYQRFREDIADEWTRRQVAAIKAADPAALVTVGLIQWSVPALLPRVSHYSGFHPERQARLLDFLEIHFYPLANGFYEYDTLENETRNLAYLESVVREAARPGKPVVVGEFGWYGGGKLSIDDGKHAAATEDQQARWCRKAIETTRGLAVGWLNWGLYDQPEAGDVSQLTGLLTPDGRLKSWGQVFKALSTSEPRRQWTPAAMTGRPPLEWDACITSVAEGNRFREVYFQAFQRND